MNFVKFLRTPFFIEHLWWLLLNRVKRKAKTLKENQTENLKKYAGQILKKELQNRYFFHLLAQVRFHINFQKDKKICSSVVSNIFITPRNLLQSNLSIADMLHNGHLVVAGTFLRNWPTHCQNLIEKPLHSGHFYSGDLL